MLWKYPENQLVPSPPLSASRVLELDRACWARLLSNLAALPLKPLAWEINDGCISLGSATDLSAEEHQTLEVCLKELIPWRKGPFEICGHPIDAEWRSNWKWDRLALENLEGSRILDIGSGNGYYMIRALEHRPRYVVGVDPSEKFYLAFQLLQRFLQSDRLQFELLGVEEIKEFQELFDVALLMGVSYHQRDPLGALRAVRETLVPGGMLVFEGFYIEGEGSYAFFPPGRYAKARNVFFIPTLSCVEAWLERSGFEAIELISCSTTTTNEQRKTPWAPFESLADFLDPEDSQKTIEGYPRPRRFVYKALRK